MRLLFIYNAKSGSVNKVLGVAHKIINPSSYNCKLCELTHSNIGERKEWKLFRTACDIDMVFYHIDEFEEKYNQQFEYPIILKDNNSELESFLTKENINKATDLTALIQEIKKQL